MPCILGIAAVVKYVEDPWKAMERWAGDLKFDISPKSQNTKVALVATFVKHAPGEYPVVIYHNDDTFIADATCFDIGDWYLDENSKLYEQWELIEHIQHPVFNYYRLYDGSPKPVIAVSSLEMYANHQIKNGHQHV